MKYIISIFSLVTIILLPAASCKKNATNDPLPPATQTGANTMGCYVNGKPWLPDTKDNGSIPRLKAVSVSFWNTNSQLYFTFYRQRNPDNQAIRLYIKDFTGLGVYNMNITSRIMGVPGGSGALNNYLNFSDDNENKQYVTNENYTGTVNITYYNTNNRIISGTFHFKGQNYDLSADSIIVTDGRFDCKID
jgi:hypothetical protein